MNPIKSKNEIDERALYSEFSNEREVSRRKKRKQIVKRGKNKADSTSHKGIRIFAKS